jgi:hypothetical protein
MRKVSERFKANEYSLINQNCNHFTEAFLTQAVGKKLPSYVNRLAKAGSWVQFMLPQSVKSLNPIPKEQELKSQSASNNRFTGKPVTLN